MLLASLGSGLQDNVAGDPRVSAQSQEAIAQTAASGTPLVPVSELEKELAKTGLPQSEQDAISGAYAQAQLDALRQALIVAALLGAAGLFFVRRLPDQPMAPDVSPAAGSA